MKGTGVLTVNVTAVNDAPVPEDANITATEDTLFTDTLNATDVDNPTLTYAIADQAAHGTATVTNAATGDFTYMPAGNYSGPDAFNFSVYDGQYTVKATITVNVTAVNDAPGRPSIISIEGITLNGSEIDDTGTLGQVLLKGSEAVDIDSTLSYKWYIDDNPLFTSPEYESSQLNSASINVSAAITANTWFYAKLEANDSAMQTPSLLFKFKVKNAAPYAATPLTPSNSSTTLDRTPTFTWSYPSPQDFDSGDNVSYQVKAYKDGILAYSSTLGLNATSATPATDMEYGNYTWYVVAYDGQAYTNSSAFNLWIRNYAPFKPTVTKVAEANASGQNIWDTTPVLYGYNSSDLNNESQTFCWLIDDVITFASPIYNSTWITSDDINGTTVNVGLARGGTYYVALVAMDSYGNTNSSAIWTITVNASANTPPNAATPVLPVNDTITSVRRPTFTYTKAAPEDVDADAVVYYILVYNDASLADINMVHNSTAITSTSYTPSVDLPLFQEYYWVVRASDGYEYTNSYVMRFATTAVIDPGTRPVIKELFVETTSSGQVLIPYMIYEGESTASRIEAQYWDSNASEWKTATMHASAGSGSLVSTSPAGVANVWAWNSAADIGTGYLIGTKIRLVGNDGQQYGEWEETGAFNINNTGVPLQYTELRIYTDAERTTMAASLIKGRTYYLAYKDLAFTDNFYGTTYIMFIDTNKYVREYTSTTSYIKDGYLYDSYTIPLSLPDGTYDVLVEFNDPTERQFAKAMKAAIAVVSTGGEMEAEIIDAPYYIETYKEYPIVVNVKCEVGGEYPFYIKVVKDGAEEVVFWKEEFHQTVATDTWTVHATELYTEQQGEMPDGKYILKVTDRNGVELATKNVVVANEAMPLTVGIGKYILVIVAVLAMVVFYFIGSRRKGDRIAPPERKDRPKKLNLRGYG